MVALPNGDLVLTRITYVGEQWTPGVAAFPDANFEKQQRAAYTFRGLEQFAVSKDCGQTWGNDKEAPWIDSKDFPECLEPGWTNQTTTAGTITPAKFDHYPGWDRGELVEDPWTGDLFFNTTCGGATLVDGIQQGSFHLTDYVWRLRPNEPEWTHIATISDYSPPRLMTTTQDGTLWIMQCKGADKLTPPNPPRAVLSVVPHATTGYPFDLAVSPQMDLADPTNPTAPGKHSCSNIVADWPSMAGDLNGNLLSGFAISRATSNEVRVAYPRTRKDGKVELVTSVVRIDRGGIAISHTTHLIEPASGSTLFRPAFIERADPQRDATQNQRNVAVLYWSESNKATNRVTMHFSVARGEADYEPSQLLDGPSGFVPHSAPGTPGNLGDYYHGAYACLGGETTFFPVWPETLGGTVITTARVDTHDPCVAPPVTGKPIALWPPPLLKLPSAPPIAPTATPTASTSVVTPANPVPSLPPTSLSAPTSPIFSSSAPVFSTSATTPPTVTRVVDPTFQPPVDNQLYQCATDTVEGTNLAGATKVTLGGHDYAVSNVTDTTLNFTVPCSYTPTGVPQTFTVTTPNGTSNPIMVTVNYFKP